MSQKKSQSRAIRACAESLVRRLVEKGAVPEAETGDLVTSLVRQWLTYNGHATLFFDGRQAHYRLGTTSLGKPRVVPKMERAAWLEHTVRDWKINAADMPGLLTQLNRGQSAEVTNADGVRLRVRVNPGNGDNGVELLSPRRPAAPKKRDHAKIAADVLRERLGEQIDDEERRALAASLVRQWLQYAGHACVFIDGFQVVFRFVERKDGTCHVDTERRKSLLEPALESLGFAPDALPRVIAEINLGNTIEFQDRQGRPSQVWHDPKTLRLGVRSFERAARRKSAPPIFCPHCGAVLRLWQADQRQQQCPQCAYSVARS